VKFSGNLVEFMSGWALVSKPFLFTMRSWDMEDFLSIDVSDGFCSNVA